MMRMNSTNSLHYQNFSYYSAINDGSIQDLAKSTPSRAIWMEREAPHKIESYLKEKIEEAKKRISNPKEKEKAEEKLQILLKNIKTPHSDLDSLLKGLFKGFDKPFKKMFSRTSPKKMERDLLLSFLVTDLAVFIIDLYIENYKERCSEASTDTTSELKEYLIKNFFGIALPSIEEKAPLTKASKQMAARILLSTSGFSDINTINQDTSSSLEYSTTTPEALLYLQKTDVSPAPDPMLHQTRKILARIKNLNNAILQGIKNQTVGEKEFKHYQKEIENLKKSAQQLNSTANTAINITIITATTSAIIKILDIFFQSEDLYSIETLLNAVNTTLEQLGDVTAIPPSEINKLVEFTSEISSIGKVAIPVFIALAPLIVSGLGTGLYAWNIKRKNKRLKELEAEEKTLFKRGAVFYVLYSNDEDLFIDLEEARFPKEKLKEIEKLYKEKNKITSSNEENIYLSLISENKDKSKYLLKQSKILSLLNAHYQKLYDTKEIHRYGLKLCLQDYLEDHPDDPNPSRRNLLIHAIKKLGLNEEHIQALKHYDVIGSDDEKQKLFASLLRVLSIKHQSILESKGQAGINLNVAKGNLGITGGSCGVAIATLAGLAIPFGGIIVASAAIIGGATTVISDYKTETFSKRTTELTRQEQTFEQALKIFSSNSKEFTLAKEAALLMTGLSLEQQRDIRALYTLNLDHIDLTKAQLQPPEKPK